MHITLTDKFNPDSQCTIDIPDHFMIQYLEDCRPDPTPGKRAFSIDAPHHTGTLAISEQEGFTTFLIHYKPKP